MTDSKLGRRRLLTLTGAALLGGLAGCNTQTQTQSDTQATSTSMSSDLSADTNLRDQDTADTATNPYGEVYNETIDSVVLVRPEGPRTRGQGTGFLYNDNHVITNAHVVGEATTADVRFSQGEWRTGSVVGSDPHSDLAAIAVDSPPESVSPIPFIDTPATIGQEVVAIGNPFDLSGTVTSGIVSGVNRSIPAPTGFTIPDAIQTDAAVNPGNSGGPLMSLDGQVVAVINSGGGDNIAFGISAALTQRVIPRLIEVGDFDHSYIGVRFESVTPEIARANGLETPRGLHIVDVIDGAPADGTLQPSDGQQMVDGTQVRVGGDIIIGIGGQRILTTEDLSSYLSLETDPGDQVPITILRNGRRRTLTIQLGKRPEQ
ncbi:S1C family serine protease [Haloquadratum walsbyi]|jgi:Trypsin-like serine proteases, typically periplasmic, contain C-terminal PDZ domain|uniref:Serine proteinase n=1 Tax=Haloquadratum walsbyi J07HQW2 TaxID=1238425 RepID=U1NIB9_9EURY|nr:trypsin-like peptidase domain-containing protein [Haloquadratum walsbyi]ERG96925.1 MAG: serine proteinase [Haloquadratum walsbyi J07HQW2]